MIDVVVIGGGPGGSVCAAHLCRRGLKVVVLEKTPFPRFHLGESLLPQSMPVLQEIGVLPRLEETFIRKYGARFHDDIKNMKERFGFDMAWKPIEHAYEVPRDTFDKILLDHARECGADVRERWTAKRILSNETDGRAVAVEVLSPEGEPHRLDARFIVDASGRDALTAHAANTATKIEGLDQTALFAHFENVPRQAGKLEGDIDIVLFPAVEQARPNWFWFIPFKDGRTSVGAVVSLGWMRNRKELVPPGADAVTALFDEAVRASPTATELLRGARCVWPKKQATADFSYRVRSMSGNGWVAIGDAGGFIDPLFSTGAHLAMCGGKQAADAIADALAAPGKEKALIEAWEANIRRASETFILAVQAFYAGPLVDVLFAPDKHTALRRSITSLLAGDVFGDSIWLRDTRNRLHDMLGGAQSK